MPAPFIPGGLPRTRCGCRHVKTIQYGMLTDTDTPSGITRAQVAGTRRRGAVAWWQRRHRLGIYVHPWSSYLDDGNRVQINFLPSNALEILFITGDSTIGRLTTAPLFRDPTAPGAFYFDWDTEDPSAVDRMRLAYNGEWVTEFTTRVNPSLNYDPIIAYAGPTLNVGMYHSGSGIGSFTISDFHYVDGARPGPLAFVAPRGEHVVALEYEGEYGPNGCHYEFWESGLGVDSSGNGRTASVVGTPERVEDGPTINRCALNILGANLRTTTTVREGNLYWSNANSSLAAAILGTVRISGCAYFEAECVSAGSSYGRNHCVVGVARPGMSLGSEYGFPRPGEYGYAASGSIYNDGVGTEGFGAGFDAGDVIGVFVDADAGEVWFFVDGAWVGNGNPDAGTNPTIEIAEPVPDLLPLVTGYAGATWRVNFGQKPYQNTPPARAAAAGITAAMLDCGKDVLSGSLLGNGSSDGPVIWSGCELESLTIGGTTYYNDGSARGVVHFLANGFKLVSTTHNVSGTTYNWTGVKRVNFKCANAVVN